MSTPKVETPCILTSRSSNDLGILHFSMDGILNLGDSLKMKLRWNGGERRQVTALYRSGVDVNIQDGEGDPLPEIRTECFVTPE